MAAHSSCGKVRYCYSYPGCTTVGADRDGKARLSGSTGSEGKQERRATKTEKENN